MKEESKEGGNDIHNMMKEANKTEDKRMMFKG